MEILLQRIVIEALERRGIIKVFAVRVRDGCVLTEDVELQLIWPPVGVPGTAAANIGLSDGTFTHCCVVVSEMYLCREWESFGNSEVDRTPHF